MKQLKTLGSTTIAYGLGLYHACSRVMLGGFVVTGLVMAVVLPPFMVPDEAGHWSIGLRRLHIARTGDDRFCAPAIALPVELEEAKVHFRYGTKWPTGNVQRLPLVRPACSSFPAAYGNLFTYLAVDAVGASVQNLTAEAGDHALHLFWLARIGSGLLIAGLLARALALSRRVHAGLVPGVLTLAVCCLSPLFLQQSFAVSADPITDAAALALAVVFLAGPAASWGDLLVCATLGLVGAQTKPVVAVLFLAFGPALLWLYPAAAGVPWYRDKRRVGAGLCVAVAAVGIGWFLVVTMGHDFAGHPEPNIDSGRQLHYLLSHPAEALATLWSGVVANAASLELWQSPLGWLDTRVPTILQNRWSGMLAAAVTSDVLIAAALLWRRLRRGPAVLARTVGLAAGVYVALSLALVAYLLAVSLAMYMSWTPVGSGIVSGVQTRYFFPAAILGAVLLAPAAQLSPAPARPLATPQRGWRGLLLGVPVAGLGLLIIDNLVWTVGALYARFY